MEVQSTGAVFRRFREDGREMSVSLQIAIADRDVGEVLSDVDLN